MIECACRSLPLLACCVFVMSGCAPPPSTLDPLPAPRDQGKTLRVGYGAGVNPEPLRLFAAEWSRERGMAIEVEAINDSEPADVLIVRPSQMPALVERGACRPLPLLDGFSSLAENLLPLFANVFSRWNGVDYGLILSGEGHLLVYRPDRFAQAELTPPPTWEDFVKAAATLGEGSLPPLPADPAGLETLFHQIAVGYDRPAREHRDNATLPDTPSAERDSSYQLRLMDGEPRVDAPAFRHALDLLRGAQPYRSTDADAFRDGRASLAIVSLADLARLQEPGSPARGKFAIAPLPGARFTFGFETGGKIPTRGGAVNRVPYLGSECLVGLIGASSGDPRTALEFLTAFADPDKNGAELIASARWGMGPTRSSQTEERNRGLWLAYDLPAASTEKLLAVLKENLAPELVNHRFPLRSPLAGPMTAEFDRIVRPAIMAKSANAKTVLGEVSAAWERLLNQAPADVRRRWALTAAGL